MNEVEKEFLSLALIRNGILLFNKENAIRFIESCRKNKLQILEIDSFILIDEYIQPNLENSVDFSSPHYKLKTENSFSEAIDFISSKEEKWYFEIVC